MNSSTTYTIRSSYLLNAWKTVGFTLGVKPRGSRLAHTLYKIPPHIQIAGEWLYARHSIHYADESGCNDADCTEHASPVENYFQMFGVYDNRFDLWLSWDAVESWSETLGVPTTPVIKKRTFDYADEVYNVYNQAKDVIRDGHEGLVMRSALPFHYGEFETRLAKYVRANHVKTDEHWRHQPITENEQRT